ncbi:MAG: hypothetical protein K0S07_377 [Chlamydiales bacterium]|jgi:hypothetical protein|nr:hypothetical protein [Chlamydiales bacterium]
MIPKQMLAEQNFMKLPLKLQGEIFSFCSKDTWREFSHVNRHFRARTLEVIAEKAGEILSGIADWSQRLPKKLYEMERMALSRFKELPKPAPSIEEIACFISQAKLELKLSLNKLEANWLLDLEIFLAAHQKKWILEATVQSICAYSRQLREKGEESRQDIRWQILGRQKGLTAPLDEMPGKEVLAEGSFKYLWRNLYSEVVELANLMSREPRMNQGGYSDRDCFLGAACSHYIGRGAYDKALFFVALIEDERFKKKLGIEIAPLYIQHDLPEKAIQYIEQAGFNLEEKEAAYQKITQASIEKKKYEQAVSLLRLLQSQDMKGQMIQCLIEHSYFAPIQQSFCLLLVEQAIPQLSQRKIKNEVQVALALRMCDEYFTWAYRIIKSIEDEEFKGRAFLSLFDVYNQKMRKQRKWQQALSSLKSISAERQKDQALSSFISYFKLDELNYRERITLSEQIIDHIVSQEFKDRAFSSLIQNLPLHGANYLKVVPLIEQILPSISDPARREEGLKAAIQRLCFCDRRPYLDREEMNYENMAKGACMLLALLEKKNRDAVLYELVLTLLKEMRVTLSQLLAQQLSDFKKRDVAFARLAPLLIYTKREEQVLPLIDLIQDPNQKRLALSLSIKKSVKKKMYAPLYKILFSLSDQKMKEEGLSYLYQLIMEKGDLLLAARCAMSIKDEKEKNYLLLLLISFQKGQMHVKETLEMLERPYEALEMVDLSFVEEKALEIEELSFYFEKMKRDGYLLSALGLASCMDAQEKQAALESLFTEFFEKECYLDAFSAVSLMEDPALSGSFLAQIAKACIAINEEELAERMAQRIENRAHRHHIYRLLNNKFLSAGLAHLRL